MQNSIKSFTLVELLIVIAILSILVTGLVFAIRPAEILAQNRDARRIGELNDINQALILLQDSHPNIFLGNQNTIYLSLPNTASICATIPAPGWTYSCVSEANLRRSDSFGWIPVHLGDFFTALPIDPRNSLDTGLYYSYIHTPGRGWQIIAHLESQRYGIAAGMNSLTITDGGSDPYAYEVGTDLTLFRYEMLANAAFLSGNLNGWTNWMSGTTGIVINPAHRVGRSAIVQGSNSFCNNYYFQDLPVQPNTVYTIGAWVRTINEAGGARVGISATNWSHWVQSAPITGTNNWTYISVSQNSGSNTTLRFHLALMWCGGPHPGNGPSGTTYFAEPSVRAGTVLHNR